MDATRLLFAGIFGTVLAAQDGAALLERVDRMRHPWPAFSVEVTLKDSKGEQRWRVRVRENGDSRVEGLSEKEKGRTVLLLGEEMWLLLPNARRPVKVSPAQRLLGPAAGGDLAHSRLSREYEVMGIHEENLDGLACHRLELQARRPKLSYHTARFWIARATGFPIRVDYFLASGKPAKTLLFEAPVQTGAMFVVPGLRLIDPTGSEGSLRFAHWKPGPQDAGLFVLPKAE
jgi:hypothetical protein